MTSEGHVHGPAKEETREYDGGVFKAYAVLFSSKNVQEQDYTNPCDWQVVLGENRHMSGQKVSVEKIIVPKDYSEYNSTQGWVLLLGVTCPYLKYIPSTNVTGIQLRYSLISIFNTPRATTDFST